MFLLQDGAQVAHELGTLRLVRDAALQVGAVQDPEPVETQLHRRRADRLELELKRIEKRC